MYRTPKHKLIIDDFFDGMVSLACKSSDNEHVINSCRRRGEPIPEHLLPGRFIMKLPADIREALTHLTSDYCRKQITWYEYYRS